MRLWHYKLLPYLPDAQFKGQLREIIAMMRTWRDKGKTNHLLINAVMEYSKEEMYDYFCKYEQLFKTRYGASLSKEIHKEFFHFAFGDIERVIRGISPEIYEGWHDSTYLRICMANLFEKHLGIGRSRITNEEWNRLCVGYETITGEEYKI